MGNPKKKTHAKSLNQGDLDVEDYIATFILREGFSPSQVKVSTGLMRSRSSIQFSLKKLEAQGRVTFESGAGFNISKKFFQNLNNRIPLLGRVAAGRPIEAIEDNRSVEVPQWMMKAGSTYFALQVQGLSMIDDHIEDGDLVLVKKTETAKNGDRVVALINNEATLKRFESKNGRIILHPSNKAMSSFEIEAHQEFRIAGIFSGVLRRVDG